MSQASKESKETESDEKSRGKEISEKLATRSNFPSYARVYTPKEDILREGIPVTCGLALSYVGGEAQYRPGESEVPHLKSYVSELRLSGAHYVRKLELARDVEGRAFYWSYVRPEMGAGSRGKPSTYHVVIVLTQVPTPRVLNASCQCIAG